MVSFIPEEDMPAFEKFLSDNNLGSSASDGAVPHPPPGGAAGPRPPPGGATETGNDEDNENILTTNF